jgi:hypothetical protein
VWEWVGTSKIPFQNREKIMPVNVFNTFMASILGIPAGVFASGAATALWEQLDKDLEGVIFELIKEQNNIIKGKFPDDIISWKEYDLRDTIRRDFG